MHSGRSSLIGIAVWMRRVPDHPLRADATERLAAARGALAEHHREAASPTSTK